MHDALRPFLRDEKDGWLVVKVADIEKGKAKRAVNEDSTVFRGVKVKKKAK